MGDDGFHHVNIAI